MQKILTKADMVLKRKYYINEEMSLLHIINDHHFLEDINAFHLGLGDVFRVSTIEGIMYLIGSPYETENFIDHTVYNMTYNATEESLYILQSDKLRKLPSKRVLDVIKFNGTIVKADNPFIQYWIRQILVGSEVNRAYADVEDEFLIRFYNQRQVLYVINGTYHPLNSMKIFSVKPQLDLEKCIVINDYDDITLFQLGYEIP
jgi:hypothetical protein